MRFCVYCRNQYDRNSGITFHRFPQDATQRQWLKNMRCTKWVPRDNDYLCSEHFTDDCFVKHCSRITLRKGCVPTLFHGSPQTEELLNISDEVDSINSVELVMTDNKAIVKWIWHERVDREITNICNSIEHDHSYGDSMAAINALKMVEKALLTSRTCVKTLSQYVRQLKTHNIAKTDSTCQKCTCCFELLPGDDLTSLWGKGDEQGSVYGAMLVDCFGLDWSIPADPKTSEEKICQECISKLKDAVTFKAEVLQSAKQFAEQISERTSDDTGTDINIEFEEKPGSETENIDESASKEDLSSKEETEIDMKPKKSDDPSPTFLDEFKRSLSQDNSPQGNKFAEDFYKLVSKTCKIRGGLNKDTPIEDLIKIKDDALLHPVVDSGGVIKALKSNGNGGNNALAGTQEPRKQSKRKQKLIMRPDNSLKKVKRVFKKNIK